MTKWYVRNEQTDADFCVPWKASIKISDSLAADFMAGVGRARDRNAPAFSYMTATFTYVPVDNPKDARLLELKCGVLASNVDLARALRNANAKPVLVKLSKARQVIVSKTAGKVTLGIYAPTNGGDFNELGTYEMPEDKAAAIADFIETATAGMAKKMVEANSDNAPSWSDKLPPKPAPGRVMS